MNSIIGQRLVDFNSVAALALANARHLLPRWFPTGRVQGQDFTVGNVRGDRGDSLHISLKNGRWIDFAAPACRGGDLVSLNAARLGVSQAEAATLVCAGLGVGASIEAQGGARRTAPARAPFAPTQKDALAEDTTGEQQHRVAAALRIWSERRPLLGSPAAVYLQRRLRLSYFPDLDIEDLAFHPNCLRGCGTAPAMLALLRDAKTMQPCGIHRTFLRPDGSGKDGDGGKAKMMLGRAKGAVVALTSSSDVTMGLGITEGIEDALTLLCRGWAPMWACGSAGAVGGLPVLEGIEALTIFGDNNDAGLDGARECATRWAEAGREVTVHIPRQDGADWNAIHAAGIAMA